MYCSIYIHALKYYLPIIILAGKLGIFAKIIQFSLTYLDKFLDMMVLILVYNCFNANFLED